jgi:nuclear pore complex protein Nup188
LALPSVTDQFKVDDRTNPSLTNFLNDALAKKCLNSPFDPFTPPSADGKALYDRLTAAINIAPCAASGYDIKEIKADATWLSNEVKIDQASALRIVILEYQARPKELLLSNIVERELDGSGDPSAASSFFAQSTFLKESQAENGDIGSGFLSKDSKQTRLLTLYLTERLHVLRTTDALVRHYLESMHLTTDEKSCLVDTAGEICKNVCHSDLSNGATESCLFEFVGALKQRMNRLEAGSGWFATEGGREQMEIQWQQNQINEIIPALQLIIYVALRVPPSSKAVVAYFNLLLERSFFHFDGVSRINLVSSSTNRDSEC